MGYVFHSILGKNQNLFLLNNFKKCRRQKVYEIKKIFFKKIIIQHIFGGKYGNKNIFIHLTNNINKIKLII